MNDVQVKMDQYDAEFERRLADDELGFEVQDLSGHGLDGSGERPCRCRPGQKSNKEASAVLDEVVAGKKTESRPLPSATSAASGAQADMAAFAAKAPGAKGASQQIEAKIKASAAEEPTTAAAAGDQDQDVDEKTLKARQRNKKKRQ